VAIPIGEERAERLDAAMQILLNRAETLPQDVRPPSGSGDWSVMQILGHVAEFVPYWAGQAQAIALRPANGQPFGRPTNDPDRLEAVDKYVNDPPRKIVPLLRTGLSEAQALLRAIPEEGWQRTARHPTRGEMTVEQIVDQFLIDHVVEHSRQLDAVATPDNLAK
jgi:uncharacterized damage-inducible protein DinB